MRYPHFRIANRSSRKLCALLALACQVVACQAAPADAPLDNGRLAAGTWGGDSAGVLVTDSLVHVHIGCTYGDITGRVEPGADGRFTRSGEFLLRAYPVAIGPMMPAQFVGRVSGNTLTITVTVTDTIARQTVIRGPATVQFGKEPRMANCPICRTPGERMLGASSVTPARWYDGIRRWFGRERRAGSPHVMP